MSAAAIFYGVKVVQWTSVVTDTLVDLLRRVGQVGEGTALSIVDRSAGGRLDVFTQEPSSSAAVPLVKLAKLRDAYLSSAVSVAPMLQKSARETYAWWLQQATSYLAALGELFGFDLRANTLFYPPASSGDGVGGTKNRNPTASPLAFRRMYSTTDSVCNYQSVVAEYLVVTMDVISKLMFDERLVNVDVAEHLQRFEDAANILGIAHDHLFGVKHHHHAVRQGRDPSNGGKESNTLSFETVQMRLKEAGFDKASEMLVFLKELALFKANVAKAVICIRTTNTCSVDHMRGIYAAAQQVLKGADDMDWKQARAEAQFYTLVVQALMYVGTAYERGAVADEVLRAHWIDEHLQPRQFSDNVNGIDTALLRPLRENVTDNLCVMQTLLAAAPTYLASEHGLRSPLGQAFTKLRTHCKYEYFGLFHINTVALTQTMKDSNALFQRYVGSRTGPHESVYATLTVTTFDHNISQRYKEAGHAFFTDCGLGQWKALDMVTSSYKEKYESSRTGAFQRNPPTLPQLFAAFLKAVQLDHHRATEASSMGQEGIDTQQIIRDIRSRLVDAGLSLSSLETVENAVLEMERDPDALYRYANLEPTHYSVDKGSGVVASPTSTAFGSLFAQAKDAVSGVIKTVTKQQTATAVDSFPPSDTGRRSQYEAVLQEEEMTFTEWRAQIPVPDAKRWAQSGRLPKDWATWPGSQIGGHRIYSWLVAYSDDEWRVLGVTPDIMKMWGLTAAGIDVHLKSSWDYRRAIQWLGLRDIWNLKR